MLDQKQIKDMHTKNVGTPQLQKIQLVQNVLV